MSRAMMLIPQARYKQLQDTPPPSDRTDNKDQSADTAPVDDGDKHEHKAREQETVTASRAELESKGRNIGYQSSDESDDDSLAELLSKQA
jgi:hypothetical protein